MSVKSEGERESRKNPYSSEKRFASRGKNAYKMRTVFVSRIEIGSSHHRHHHIGFMASKTNEVPCVCARVSVQNDIHAID